MVAKTPPRTLSIVGVDRDRTYFYWQWNSPELSVKKIYRADQEALAGPLERLAAAIPASRSDESDEDMVTRILTHEAFATVENEVALSSEFAALLLPADLAKEIADAFVSNDRRPILIRLMPSATTAQVPWELLPITVPGPDGASVTMRLIEVADILQEVPAGVHAGRARLPQPWQQEVEGTTLFVIDPRTNVAGPVLDESGHEAFRARMALTGHPTSRVDSEFNRRHLHEALTAQTPPNRLIYVGHVVMSEDSPGATSLLLSDNYQMFGVTAAFNVVQRPLSALDILEGTKNSERRIQYILEYDKVKRRDIKWPAEREIKQSGAEIWPMPSRVVLVACDSGADLRNPEPFGLALALINAGAELVTATKWTLPTDRAFHLLDGVASDPLLDTALALDDAHATQDPVSAISHWQRGRLAEWQSGATAPTASPILWAAFSTYVGTERKVEAFEPTTDTARLLVAG